MGKPRTFPTVNRFRATRTRPGFARSRRRLSKTTFPSAPARRSGGRRTPQPRSHRRLAREEPTGGVMERKRKAEGVSERVLDFHVSREDIERILLGRSPSAFVAVGHALALGVLTFVTKLQPVGPSSPPLCTNATHGLPPTLFLSGSHASRGTASRNVPATPSVGTRGPKEETKSLSSKCEFRVTITTLLPSSAGICESAASMNTMAMGIAAHARAKKPSQQPMALPRKQGQGAARVTRTPVREKKQRQDSKEQTQTSRLPLIGKFSPLPSCLASASSSLSTARPYRWCVACRGLRHDAGPCWGFSVRVPFRARGVVPDPDAGEDHVHKTAVATRQ